MTGPNRQDLYDHLTGQIDVVVDAYHIMLTLWNPETQEADIESDPMTPDEADLLAEILRNFASAIRKSRGEDLPAKTLVPGDDSCN